MTICLIRHDLGTPLADPLCVLTWMDGFTEFHGSSQAAGFYSVYEILTGTKFPANYWDGDSILAMLRETLVSPSPALAADTQAASSSRQAFGTVDEFDRLWTLMSVSAIATYRNVRPLTHPSSSAPSSLRTRSFGGDPCEGTSCSGVNWGNSHGNVGTPIGTDRTVPVAPTTTTVAGVTLPNSYPNLHKMLVDYKSALPLYLREFGDTDTPGSEFWALEWMCNNSAYAGACGKAFSNDLLAAYRQKTEAIAFDFAGLAEGITDALPGGLPEGEAKFDLADDAAATADANTITEDFEGASCSFSQGTLVLLAGPGGMLPLLRVSCRVPSTAAATPGLVAQGGHGVGPAARTGHGAARAVWAAW